MKRCWLAWLILPLALACGRNRKMEQLWIYVPGGGAREQCIRQLIQEMGIQAHIASEREVYALRPKDFQQIRSFICFEGKKGTCLQESCVRSMVWSGGSLFLVGESTFLAEQALGVRVHVTEGDHHWNWTEAARPYLTPGTFRMEDGAALEYGYGVKQSQGWFFDPVQGNVWANTREGRPRWAECAWGQGRVSLIGFPLSTQASDGDTYGARLLLECAADRADLARLWPTPKGLGGIAVNIHLDSADHLRYLPQLVAGWPTTVRGTFHVTAGPDCDREEDGLGLDAENPAKGGAWMKRIGALGEIGLHGGWAHNLWALEAPTWPQEKRERFLELNRQTLQSTGPLTSYSSPSGQHPENINAWLAAHGFVAFYFTGDSGAPPTRIWQEGHPFGVPMWAFPVATDGDAAASYEFKHQGMSEAEAKRWSLAVVDFCRSHQTLRLMYGHSIDWGDMPDANFAWLNLLAKQVKQGHMTAWTLSEYAAFLNRFVDVKWSFEQLKDTATIRMEGPALKDMTLRIPGRWRCGEPGIQIRSENAYTWITIEDNRKAWTGRLTR